MNEKDILLEDVPIENINDSVKNKMVVHNQLKLSSNPIYPGQIFYVEGVERPEDIIFESEDSFYSTESELEEDMDENNVINKDERDLKK